MPLNAERGNVGRGSPMQSRPITTLPTARTYQLDQCMGTGMGIGMGWGQPPDDMHVKFRRS